MASITFSGQLDQAMNELAAEGNKILFIPHQTVGEVLTGAASEMVVESDGTYSITLAYNTYSIYHYSDVTKRKTLIATDVVVSADTLVTTIPDLIGSTVPVTEDSVLTIQGYLTDAQNSATAAATSESNAAASEAAVTNRVAAYEVETTEYLINTFDGSALEVGDVVRTLGYYTAGDGGGAEWVNTGDTGTSSQGPESYYSDGLFITDANSIKYEITDELKNNLNVKKAGVTSASSNNFERLSACANASYSKILTIDDDITSDSDDMITFSDVIFVGKGSIDGLYRKWVFDDLESVSEIQLTSNIKPIAKQDESNVVAVMTGDSISTFAANSRNRNYMLTQVLESKLRSEIDGVDFYNRAIGGETLSDLDGVSSRAADGDVDWYTDETKAWLDYVEELNPDIVFISMGMNDGNTMTLETLDSVVSKIKQFKSEPQIIMLTCLVPSLSWNGSAATESFFEGRDYCSGLIRSYCQYYKIGLIDVNRQHNLVRDGMDVVYGRIGNQSSIAADGLINYGEIDCHNYRVIIRVNENLLSGSDMFSVYFDSSNVARCDVYNDGGFYKFEVIAGTSSAEEQVLLSETTSVAVGTDTSRDMTFEIKSNSMVIYEYFSATSSETNANFLSTEIIRVGGYQTPTIEQTVTGLTTSFVFCYSNPFISKPTIKDTTLWADWDDGEAIGEYDGNGSNHPSNHVVNYCYLPCLSQFRFYKEYGSSMLNLGTPVFSAPLNGSLVIDAGEGDYDVISVGGTDYDLTTRSMTCQSLTDSTYINASGTLKTVSAGESGFTSKGIWLHGSYNVYLNSSVDSELNLVTDTDITLTSNIAPDRATYWATLTQDGNSNITLYQGSDFADGDYLTCQLFVRKGTGSVSVVGVYNLSVNDGSGSRYTFNSDDPTSSTVSDDVVYYGYVDHGDYYEIYATFEYLDANSTQNQSLVRLYNFTGDSPEIWGVNVNDASGLRPYRSITTGVTSSSGGPSRLYHQVDGNLPNTGESWSLVIDLTFSIRQSNRYILGIDGSTTTDAFEGVFLGNNEYIIIDTNGSFTNLKKTSDFLRFDEDEENRFIFSYNAYKGEMSIFVNGSSSNNDPVYVGEITMPYDGNMYIGSKGTLYSLGGKARNVKILPYAVNESQAEAIGRPK